nr:MAG TPA: hypothetical protein [Caudoviricetes sp.]
MQLHNKYYSSVILKFYICEYIIGISRKQRSL